MDSARRQNGYGWSGTICTSLITLPEETLRFNGGKNPAFFSGSDPQGQECLDPPIISHSH